MTNYQQFVEDVKKSLEERLGDSYCVSNITNIKNNNSKKIGITIKDSQSNISPTIYMESFYSMFNNGDSLEEVVELIIQSYNQIKNEQQSFEKSFDTSVLTNFNLMRPKIVFKLINRDRNKEILDSIPHVPYMDLEITFYAFIEASDNGTATIPITNQLMDKWRVGINSIINAAIENSTKILPPVCKPMNIVLDELEDAEHQPSGMYVLSNIYNRHGASCILYDGMLKRIGEIFDENFYIIPSSVDEVILIPASDIPDEMSEIVKEINETVLEDEEFLSDNIYLYDTKTDTVSISNN